LVATPGVPASGERKTRYRLSVFYHDGGKGVYVMGKLEDIRKQRGKGDGKSPDSGLYTYQDDAAERFPCLYAMLAQQLVEGKSRETATLILFSEAGKLKFTLNDRHDAMVGFGSVGSLETILDDVEAMLADGKVDWRPSKSSTR
jgi:hypothetical protein